MHFESRCAAGERMLEQWKLGPKFIIHVGRITSREAAAKVANNGGRRCIHGIILEPRAKLTCLV